MPDNLALSLPADLQTDNQLLSPASPAVPGNNRLSPQPDGGTDKQPLSRRLCTACGGGIPSRRRAYCSDRCARRVRREQREHSFHDKIAAVRRQLRAMARTAGRVQGQDRQEPGVVFEELALLHKLEDEFRTDLQLAINGLRARGASWGEIGATFGISRQGARQRWGVP